MKMILSRMIVAGMFLVFIALASGAGAAGSGGKDEPAEQRPLITVERVDLARYMGKWYEIATITAPFQKDCAGGTTATYTALPDGTVEVLNQCCQADGTLKQARGRAWVDDAATNAKLKVSFIPWLRLSFLAGDYWIIDLGPDYEYAVVGHPSRRYGWILGRASELPADVLAGIKQRLTEQGYDVDRFKMTDQKNFGPGK
ncbi:MAG TPA: lipocalin family protein [bacterium]|nr:lipocalin family protein [bacterium]